VPETITMDGNAANVAAIGADKQEHDSVITSRQVK
jgi:hypothetical protein